MNKLERNFYPSGQNDETVSDYSPLAPTPGIDVFAVEVARQAQRELQIEEVQYLESKEGVLEEVFFPQLGVIVPTALTREKVRTDILPKVQEVLQASGMSEEDAKIRIAKSLGVILEAKDKNISMVRDDVLRILHNMNYELATETPAPKRNGTRRKDDKASRALADKNKREQLLKKQSDDFQKILDARKRRAQLKEENKN